MADYAKKGFTLVELMVVIAIIGILAAALITPITNARASAQAIRCKVHLRNLAQAALSFALDNGEQLPHAGTYDWLKSSNAETGIVTYEARLGWVSGYYGGNPWPREGSPFLGKSADMKGSYLFHGENRNRVFQSITNGVLWSYVGRDLGTYACDTHKAVARRAGCQNVVRSYVMNAFFGGNVPTSFYGSSATSTPADREKATKLSRLSDRGHASTLLLFAELPAYNDAGQEDVNRGSEQNPGPADGILDVEIRGYSSSRPNPEEVIGFNHRLAKRMVAHVAFADGHVDAIIAPDGARTADLRNLTFLLCNGLEVPAEMSEWSNLRSEWSGGE